MRNPERIKKIIKLLEKAWTLVPDWRLGQLVSNLLGTGPQDVFFPEDEDWEKYIKSFIDFCNDNSKEENKTK